jgi:hypothetical protein
MDPGLRRGDGNSPACTRAAAVQLPLYVEYDHGVTTSGTW